MKFQPCSYVPKQPKDSLEKLSPTCVAFAVSGEKMCTAHAEPLKHLDWLRWADATFVYKSPAEKLAARERHRDMPWWDRQKG